jgi:hypothetical protein
LRLTNNNYKKKNLKKIKNKKSLLLKNKKNLLTFVKILFILNKCQKSYSCF